MMIIIIMTIIIIIITSFSGMFVSCGIRYLSPRFQAVTMAELVYSKLGA